MTVGAATNQMTAAVSSSLQSLIPTAPDTLTLIAWLVGLVILAIGLAQLSLELVSRLGRIAAGATQRPAEESVRDVGDEADDAERGKPISAHLSKNVRPSWSLVCVALVIRLALPVLLEDRPPVWVATSLNVATILFVGWFLLQSARAIRLWLDERFDISVADNLRQRRMRTQIAFIERIFDMLVFVLTIAAVLSQFESGRKLSTGLLASAGVASLVIGFAAQRTLANLLAGFQIAFTSPIRIDDAVVVEREWGWIEEISLTYVVVRVWNRRRLVLPITYFVEKPFQNWTRKSGQILGSVFLEVAHHTPFEPLNEELNRLLDAHPKWDGDARVLQVVEMKERCVQLRALMTAENSPDCWDLRCAIRRGLIEFLVRNYPDCLPSTRLTVLESAMGARDQHPRETLFSEEPRRASGE